MYKELSEYDWRLQAITTLTEDTTSPYGTPMKSGEPVVLAHLLNINGKEASIYTPNPTAMYLNLSNNSYCKSVENFDFKKLTEKGKLIEEKYYDALEQYMASIIFAFTALEIFANYSIPDSYVYKKLRNDKKCYEIYSKEQIEKNIKLDLKLGAILPKIFKIQSFKGTSLWEKYLELKNIRDRLIHLKSKDTQYNDKSDPYSHLWNDLINDGNLTNYATRSKRIIRYFLPEKKPRWFKKCPF